LQLHRLSSILGNENREVAMSERLKIAVNTGGGDAPGSMPSSMP